MGGNLFLRRDNLVDDGWAATIIVDSSNGGLGPPPPARATRRGWTSLVTACKADLRPSFLMSFEQSRNGEFRRWLSAELGSRIGEGQRPTWFFSSASFPTSSVSSTDSDSVVKGKGTRAKAPANDASTTGRTTTSSGVEKSKPKAKRQRSKAQLYILQKKAAPVPSIHGVASSSTSSPPLPPAASPPHPRHRLLIYGVASASTASSPQPRCRLFLL
nr:hypothetical protein Iba_chr03bCG5030 [Ipomoea batatas]